MSNEELLKPRYKVIADYPKSVYYVGDIINAGTTSEDCIYCDREGPRMRHYPHLFKKLEWYEERKPEEMPEYVKHEHGWIDKHIGISHSGDSFVFIGRNDTVEWEFKYFTPATPAEYEQYINQKEKQ